MTIPIIMIGLMVTPYLLARCFAFATKREFDPRGAATMGLGILFAFTGIGHFSQTESMAEMLPSWVPQRVVLVYVSGILELALAVGMFLPKGRRLAGWTAFGTLLLFFPVNVYAAFHHVPMGGHEWGPVYLLIRGPLQLMILFWVYWFTLKEPNRSSRPPAAGRRG